MRNRGAGSVSFLLKEGIKISQQPVSGDQYVIITGVGSVVLAGGVATLKRVFLPGSYIGTVSFYDSATVAGTAAGNNVITFGSTVDSNSMNRSVELNARCIRGLVYTAQGTPTMTAFWD